MFDSEMAAVLYRDFKPDAEATCLQLGWAGLYRKPDGNGGYILRKDSNDFVILTMVDSGAELNLVWDDVVNAMAPEAEPSIGDWVVAQHPHGFLVTQSGSEEGCDNWQEVEERIKERRHPSQSVWLLEPSGYYRKIEE